MAKQEKKKDIDKDIDYISLIEQMSDDVFEFCVSYLYPMFDYKILKPEDLLLCRMFFSSTDGEGV